MSGRVQLQVSRKWVSLVCPSVFLGHVSGSVERRAPWAVIVPDHIWRGTQREPVLIPPQEVTYGQVIKQFYGAT